MSPRRIYLAFPDGALHYDCESCQALCCRGHGIAARADRELLTLLRMKPDVSRWVVRQRGSMAFLTTPHHGCWFLDAQNHCSVELTAGRAHKPSVCRAFPFNHAWALGEARVVAPHFLCPLQLRLGAAEPLHGQHARVLEDLTDSGWLEQPLDALRLAPDESPELFLQHEQQLRDSCQEQLANGRLDRCVEQLTPEAAHTLPQLAALFAWTELVPPALEPYFLALAPTWSLEHSQLPLPARRRALLLARLHVSHALAADERAPSLKLCYALWSAHKPLLELLALGPEPMPRGLLADTADGASLLAAAIADRAAQHGASTLEALEESLLPLALHERFALGQVLGHTLQSRSSSR